MAGVWISELRLPNWRALGELWAAISTQTHGVTVTDYAESKTLTPMLVLRVG
jgi:hypothetical protein